MKYTAPEMSVVMFEAEEVICASATDPVVTEPGNDDNIGNFTD